MHASDLMAVDTAALVPTDSVAHAARLMRDTGVNQLLHRLRSGHVRRPCVIDGDKRLVGAVTLEDVAHALGGRYPLRLAALMHALSAPPRG